MDILKADGNSESFQREKLITSLLRSGASAKIAEEIALEIEGALRPGITTREIYRKAFTILRTRARPIASRYSLRQAILDLGPTGFPFEKFVAEIFKAQGFATTVDILIPGKCVIHEVDVLAMRGNDCIGIEAKFHNRFGERSDVKVALYVHARFLDIKARAQARGERCPLTHGWLVTNTKFTEQAIQYGTCADITMIGWSYPKNGNLQDLIEKSKVHPLTCLTTLSSTQKRQLLSQGTVLCTKLAEDVQILRSIGMPDSSASRVVEESKQLCYT